MLYEVPRDKINEAADATADAFIGASDSATEATWEWVDGTAWGYTNWSAGEPDDSGGAEDCASKTAGGEWNDRPCADLRPFVCESAD